MIERLRGRNSVGLFLDDIEIEDAIILMLPGVFGSVPP